MMSTVSALVEWFTQFGIPVYQEGDVPDDAEAPYITLPIKEPEWDRQTAYHFMVWYKSTSNLALIQKADEIVAAVGVGVRIPCQGGVLVLWPDTPLMQEQLDGDYRGMYISLILNAYHMPGV